MYPSGYGTNNTCDVAADSDSVMNYLNSDPRTLMFGFYTGPDVDPALSTSYAKLLCAEQAKHPDIGFINAPYEIAKMFGAEPPTTLMMRKADDHLKTGQSLETDLGARNVVRAIGPVDARFMKSVMALSPSCDYLNSTEKLVEYLGENPKPLVLGFFDTGTDEEEPKQAEEKTAQQFCMLAKDNTNARFAIGSKVLADAFGATPEGGYLSALSSADNYRSLGSALNLDSGTRSVGRIANAGQVCQLPLTTSTHYVWK